MRSFWMLLLLLLPLVAIQPGDALAPDGRRNNHKRRGAALPQQQLFTHEVLLPPLPLVAYNGKQKRQQPPRQGVAAFVRRDLPVTYTNDPRSISTWLSHHVPSRGCTLGLDVESVPVAPWILKRASFLGPATVQLATVDSSLVVHLTPPGSSSATGSRSRTRRSRGGGSATTTSSVVRLLQAVLQDASIIKAGCNIDQDLLDLKHETDSHVDFGRLQAQSRLDLGNLRFLEPESNHDSPGLKTLSQRMLGVDLPKSRRLAVSDWSTVPLTPAQLAYGARDAWAGAAVAATLQAADPASYASYIQQLQKHEGRLSDLHRRRKRRKRAQYQLKSLLAPYQMLASNQTRRGNSHGSSTQSLLSPSQVQRVRQLKAVVKENRWPRGPELHVDGSLLFPPPSPTTATRTKKKAENHGVIIVQEEDLQPSLSSSSWLLPLHNRTGHETLC